jgi:phosphohistidine phosphatase
MKLYLVQHGKAVPEEVDRERPLTEEGRREVEKVASFVKKLDLSVDYLWHSGKKRAAQTAQILAEVVKVRKGSRAREGLAPNDDVGAIREELAASGDVLIVGHLPFLSKLASLLLTGSESAGAVAFKNGGIVCLSLSDEKRWQLEWAVTPELLV